MPLSTSAITMPVLPVVMPQAETASVADASVVATPSTVAGPGVFMYHWPLAVPGVGRNKGFGRHDERVAQLVHGGKLHRGIGAQFLQNRLDVGAVERLLQEQHVHARRELAALREA